MAEVGADLEIKFQATHDQVYGYSKTCKNLGLIHLDCCKEGEDLTAGIKLDSRT